MPTAKDHTELKRNVDCSSINISFSSTYCLTFIKFFNLSWELEHKSGEHNGD